MRVELSFVCHISPGEIITPARDNGVLPLSQEQAYIRKTRAGPSRKREIVILRSLGLRGDDYTATGC